MSNLLPLLTGHSVSVSNQHDFQQMADLLDLLDMSGVSGLDNGLVVWTSSQEDGQEKGTETPPPPVDQEMKEEPLTPAYQCRICGKMLRDKDSARGHTTVHFKIPQVGGKTGK